MDYLKDDRQIKLSESQVKEIKFACQQMMKKPAHGADPVSPAKRNFKKGVRLAKAIIVKPVKQDGSKKRKGKEEIEDCDEYKLVRKWLEYVFLRKLNLEELQKEAREAAAKDYVGLECLE